MSPSPDKSIRILGERLARVLQVKPQTSKELAAMTGYSERHIRQVLSTIPGIIRQRDGQKILYSITAAPPAQAPESAPSDRTTKKGDTEREIKGIPETEKKGVSLLQCIIQEMQNEPDRPFVILDLVERTGGNYESVKRYLSTLSSPGKGGGPVRRIAHGIYKYAPEKESDSLQVLVRSDNWKFENIRFVKSIPMGARGGVASLSEKVPEPDKGILLESSQSVPHPDVPYPRTTPTGHLVIWEDYQNGTQVISISANGSPPLSPGEVLLIIDDIKESGMDESWSCTSIEANIDSRAHIITGSHSLQLIEGVLLKAYQHGYNARIEIADRRKVTMKEIMNLFHSMANTFDGQAITRQVKGMEERVTRCERTASHAITIAAKVRDEPGRGPTPSTKKAQQLGFRTGTEIKRDHAPAPAPGAI